MFKKTLKAVVITLILTSLLLAWSGCSKSAATTTTTNPPATSTQPPTTTPTLTTTPSLTTTMSMSTTTTVSPTTTPPATTTLPPTTTPSTPSNVVLIQGFSFIPNPIIVPVGTRVVWDNLDMTDHTVTSDTPGIFDNPAPAGGSTSITFTVPGTYSYHCTPHTDMVGTVIVR
jgi:plastocyanin